MFIETSDLKPCPFCGHRLEVITTDSGYPDTGARYYRHPFNIEGCPLSGSHDIEVWDEADMESWNTRAPNPKE